MNLPVDDLNFIGECFLNDIDIRHRYSSATPDLEKSINRLTQIFTSHVRDVDIVYTAFDGDHFHLLQNMRKYVLQNQLIPANPESILGYKNVVTRYQTKYNVLLDDLAILQNCDEMWVFTDFGTDIEDVIQLPEGILVEIAFFLKRRLKANIKFISISELLTSFKPASKNLTVTFEELEARFLQSDRAEILSIANSNFRIDSELKNLVYYITDPLDYKYSEWLREGKANDHDEIALVPGLAVRISDVEIGVQNIGNVVLSWISILQKLSKKRAYVLNSFDSKRGPSIIAEAIKKSCIQLKGSKYLESKKWTSYGIPKAIQKDKWPITKFESNQI